MRNRWWLIPELAVAGTLLMLYLGGFGGDGTDAIARQAAAVIEQSSPTEHAAHGHEVSADDQIFCGMHVFGVRGQTVYGYYFCALGRRGVPYLESSRIDGPVVVTLGPTPSASIAPPGEGYRETVKAMMPDEYEQYCFSGLPDPSVAAEVRARYMRALGA